MLSWPQGANGARHRGRGDRTKGRANSGARRGIERGGVDPHRQGALDPQREHER